MQKKAPSKSLARLNEDMRREITAIVGALKDPRTKNGLLTITRVEADKDLSQCKVYVSVLGPPADEKSALAALLAAKGHVRSELAKNMHIRRAPEIVFIQDDSAAYVEHINKLLKDLKP